MTQQHRPRILVVDDVPENVELLGEMLSMTYDVQCAFSGEETLALVEQHVPDLILLDVMMPGIDGYEVCVTLKSQFSTRDIPVIFVTAKNDPDSESAALAAGAVDFIHKPVNADVVRARVSLHLGLKAKERQLREMNETLDKRVAERTRELKVAMLRAESAARAKSTFLANMSHEIRTPLNAILGLGMLAQRKIDDPKAQEMLTQSLGAAQHLLRVVDDILELSRIEAGKLEIQLADFATADLLARLDARFADVARDKGLAWSISSTLPPELHGDGERIEQLLINLIDNALKFTQQGSVALTATVLHREGTALDVRFEVRDTGIGIPVGHQARIFEAFEQGDGSPSRRHGGAGLGLAITRKIAQALGGDVLLSSQPGEGSCFSLDLRLQAAAG